MNRKIAHFFGMRGLEGSRVETAQSNFRRSLKLKRQYYMRAQGATRVSRSPSCVWQLHAVQELPFALAWRHS
eukprot:6191626-Pleurochrysis_carterae.AAC.1